MEWNERTVAGARVEMGDLHAPEIAEDSPLHFGRGRRLPMIRQTEAAECGLACLAMISGFHGYQAGLPALRQRFSPSLKGMTLSQLIDVAHPLGLACRPLKLEINELSRLQLPCILHWDLNHFVVLRETKRRGVVIHDPAVGIRSLPYEECASHFTGVALELSPTPVFQRKRADPPLSLRTLAGSIKGLWRSLTQIFCLALVLELFALLVPQFMQIVVDQVLADGDYDLLTLVGMSFILVLFLQTAISTLRTWLVIWLGTHFNLSWTGNVFQHLMRLPQSYFIKRHLGDVVSRFGAISTIQQTLSVQFVTVILDGLMAVLTLAVLFAYSVLLAGITVTAVIIYAGLRILYFQIFREANLGQIIVNAKQQSFFMESVRGVQTLRLYNGGPMQTSRYLNVTADALNASVAVQRLNLVFGSLNNLTSGAQRVAILWLGAWLALRGQFTAGMLMAFVTYANQFTMRSVSLVDYMIQLRLLRLQGERLADIVMTPPEPFADGTYVGPAPSPSIRFDNVSFRYAEGDPWILHHCSFEIRSGESVAIIGPSGCGKSTLARLMLGLLEQQGGTISVGGIDLRHLGKTAYRNMIASVMQDDRLFAGSVADNISFFNNTATRDNVERAASMAQLHDDLRAMPMGYHTLVGDMGTSLSGGQQQRLFLARALYRNPEILLLDEATSHLDLTCESAINDVLDSLEITRIVIAHRPETIERASRVLVMDSGGISERKSARTSMAIPRDAGVTQPTSFMDSISRGWGMKW